MTRFQPAPAAAGRFIGYASVFDRLDDGRDLVAPGAFARTLARTHQLPLLWQHDPKAVIGRIDQLREDAFGLQVAGTLALDVQRGREAWALMTGNALDGLSIGYRVRKATTDPKTRVRRLVDLDLIEVSLVTFPMQPAARLRPLARASPALP